MWDDDTLYFLLAPSLPPSRRREVKGDKHHQERERAGQMREGGRGEGKEAAKRGPTTARGDVQNMKAA